MYTQFAHFAIQTIQYGLSLLLISNVCCPLRVPCVSVRFPQYIDPFMTTQTCRIFPIFWVIFPLSQCIDWLIECPLVKYDLSFAIALGMCHDWMVIDWNVPVIVLFEDAMWIGRCVSVLFVNVSFVAHVIGPCLSVMNESLFPYQTIINFVYNSNYRLVQLYNGALQQLVSLKPSRMCVGKLDERWDFGKR